MKKRTFAEGKQLVTDFYASGLTQREYITQKGVKLCTLQYWKSRVKKIEDSTETSSRNRFIEITPSKNSVAVVEILVGAFRISFSSLPPTSWLNDFISSLSNNR